MESFKDNRHSHERIMGYCIGVCFTSGLWLILDGLEVVYATDVCIGIGMFFLAAVNYTFVRRNEELELEVLSVKSEKSGWEEKRDKLLWHAYHENPGLWLTSQNPDVREYAKGFDDE